MQSYLSTEITNFLIALIILLYCLLQWKNKNHAKRKQPPMPSNSWPIIGHLHLLKGLPHIALAKLAHQYGPIFMIKLGVRRALVVSSAEMAKECLAGMNDSVFVNRPKDMFVEHMTYNSAMFAFSPHGQYWRDMRKIITAELLSNTRIQMCQNVRISEVRSAINKVAYAEFNSAVDMKQWFGDINLNIILMILGATDTTTATLIWTLSLLLNNKDVLKKTQAELDTIVGKERKVEESDLKNLVYLQAVLKEAMRLYPAGPLSLPRESITDCTVGGYHIPAHTELFVNLHKMHRDPLVWENPLVFNPERFLTTHKDYDVRGQNYEYMPFGNGKRICPGISFALQNMQFTLASLLHGFEITLPSNDQSVDMTHGFGTSNLKATPLEVMLTRRLPRNLYDEPTMELK